MLSVTGRHRPAAVTIVGTAPGAAAAFRAALALGCDVYLSGDLAVDLDVGGHAVANGTKLIGVGSPTISLSSAGTDYRSFFTVAGSFEASGVNIERTSNVALIMVVLQSGANGVSFTDCTFHGNRDLHALYCHGTIFPETGCVSLVSYLRCTWQEFNYPTIQNNTSTAVVAHVDYTDCSVLQHTGEALGFNAPFGSNRYIDITDCTVTSNRGHLGISFAHVQEATVTGCYVSVADEGVHIEDYSSGIVVSGNEFHRCSEVAPSEAVIEIHDSHYLTITNNIFTNPDGISHAFHGIVNPHGETTGTTVGGKPRLGATHHIAITNNTFTLDADTPAIYTYLVTDLTDSGNTITRP